MLSYTQEVQEEITDSEVSFNRVGVWVGGGWVVGGWRGGRGWVNHVHEKDNKRRTSQHDSKCVSCGHEKPIEGSHTKHVSPSLAKRPLHFLHQVPGSRKPSFNPSRPDAHRKMHILLRCQWNIHDVHRCADFFAPWLTLHATVLARKSVSPVDMWDILVLTQFARKVGNNGGKSFRWD